MLIHIVNLRSVLTVSTVVYSVDATYDRPSRQGALPDFDMLVFANKSIYNRVWMVKDLIKAILTSRGLNSGLVSTLVLVQTRVQTFGLCTRVWTGTSVDTRPRSPLLVGIVY